MNESGELPAPPFRTAEEVVGWITALMPTVGIRPGLGRMELLLEKLGHPERRLKFIHVAGTNGKGSVCAMLTSVLTTCGYDVGTFTSPYITKYTDRFRYNGLNMPDDELVRLSNRLKPFADEVAATEWGPLTMFELSTALAILYFGTSTYPDYVVWETGLGGRLDVTNVVNPVISVITNVGHDHMDLLGPTLVDIAREKAGIIKPGVPVVTGVLQPEALDVLREAAASRKSTLYELGGQYRYETLDVRENAQQFAFAGPFRRIERLGISLNGPHQLANAAVTVMTLETLRQYYALIVDDESLSAGLRAAVWPGRLEKISGEPPILLDGAHNPEGMEALASALRSGIYQFDRLNVMLAMMPNKNHEHSLRHILPMVDTLVVTEPDFHKKMNARELAAVAERLRPETAGPRRILVEPDWKRALEKLKETAADGSERHTLAVVTGTLYLIADVRSWLLQGTKSDKGW